MSDWTLGSVKAHHLALDAHCEAEDCRRFYRFDLDCLIDEAGPEFLIDDIPPLTCAACGPLKIVLASIPPGSEDE